ncbi:RNA polymerase sigma-70 factor [Nocardia transvalensis]|uniref:RNA polymerase sigma-70 factor n=1 Tax=Nocardia transvalensis TaxID=37333 RepID=UPI0018944EF1|nr:RNA polymerase sigma-70 factor [Nocardia transvalensis]MBF6327728.1 RNA polymerase sigma-70 factor [Nocardia transvalensis]
MRSQTLAQFQAHRARLFGLAYRLLGDAVEAEDVVQDAYLKWDARAAADEPVQIPQAWLTKVVTNLCLNRLASARMSREQYIGPWLPTPVLTADDALGPLETVEQRETVTLAMLTLLERLTPPERAVFVLREAFDYRYRDIAELLDRDEAHVRQLYRRARTHLGQRHKRFSADPARHAEIVARFFAAAVRGEVTALEELLADEVVAWADGGGRIAMARRPIRGRPHVTRYFAALASNPRAAGITLTIGAVNGQPAALAYRDDALLAVVCVDVADDHITALYSIANPDKLAFAATQPRTDLPCQGGRPR